MSKTKELVYYLSSLESIRFEKVRECRLVKKLTFDTGKNCALVKLDPPVLGQPWGVPGDLDFFIIATRHKGAELFPISEFPCFVHIARLLKDEAMQKSVIVASDLETVAWGELYRTYSDAANHVFIRNIRQTECKNSNPKM